MYSPVCESMPPAGAAGGEGADRDQWRGLMVEVNEAVRASVGPSETVCGVTWGGNRRIVAVAKMEPPADERSWTVTVVFCAICVAAGAVYMPVCESILRLGRKGTVSVDERPVSQ